MKSIAQWILKLHGWKVDMNIPNETERCVMIAAPHTSNWDFYFMRLAFFVLQIPLKVTIKDVFTKFPFGLIIKPLGGIGINRKKSAQERGGKSYLEQMKDFFEKFERIAVVFTPEGTRARNDKWKTGFYYTALGAEKPICLGYLDYKKKVAGVGSLVVYPSGDIEKDMRLISDFYRDIAPEYPALFALDARYS